MSIQSLLRALRARRAGGRPGIQTAVDTRVRHAAHAAASSLAEPLERRVLLTDAPAAPSFAFATWAHEAARTVSVFAGVTDAAIDPTAGTGDLTATVRWTRTGGEQPVQLLDLDMPVVLTKHTYGAAGRHTAQLTVSDGEGHVLETSLRVAAPDHAPRVGDPQLDIPPAEEQDPDAYGLVPFDSRELAPDDGLPPRVTGVYLDGSTWNCLTHRNLWMKAA